MEKQERLGHDLTQGKVSTQLLRFALPFMVSNALQAVYSMVDMLVVGNYVGSAGLAAVNISSQLVFLMTALCMGFSTSGQVVIAQLMGRGERERLNTTIGTLFSTVTLFGAVMTVLGLALYKPLLNLMSTPADSYAEAANYLLICTGGLIFTFGYNMVSAVLRGMGDSKSPLLFIAIASVVNIVLDLLFVGVLQMRVAGAAWATIIGQAVSFLVSILYLYKRRAAFGFDFKAKSFAIEKYTLRTLLRLGIPYAIQMAAINISMLFVNRFINVYGGSSGSAAFGVSSKVQQVPDILTRSFGMAASGMVGQNLGAGELKRSQRTVNVALAYCSAIYVVVAVVMLLWYRPIFSIFNSEAEVLQYAWPCAITAIIAYPAHAVMSPCNSFIQGIGNARLGLIIALLDGFVARIALSYLFGVVLDMQMFGFFLGYNLATYVTAIPSAVYFYSGVWKKRRLVVD